MKWQPHESRLITAVEKSSMVSKSERSRLTLPFLSIVEITRYPLILSVQWSTSRVFSKFIRARVDVFASAEYRFSKGSFLMIAKHKRYSFIFVMVLAILSCINFARADDSAEQAPLPRDPNSVFGTFDNSLKYIVRRQPNPPGKVTLNLHVMSGGLNETESQNGLAHFLEHMAFKGSEHFKPMQLIPLLSRMGMTFGADTNAHTTETETLFKLTIPDNKPETIDTALTIFSDYASALDLYPIQIESEQRVILEEKRMRNTLGWRIGTELNKEMYPGTQIARHDVLGKDEGIKTFQQPEFLDYWNTWYRPENMTLIVVGDIDPQTFIAAAKAKLGTFKSRAPARQPLDPGIKPPNSTQVYILTDPEQVTADFRITNIAAKHGPMTTYGQFRHELVEGVAEWIVDRRFINEISSGSAPFHDAGVDSGDIYNSAFEADISSSGEPHDWNRMVDATIGDVNKAFDHGFTTHEFDLAKRGMIAAGEWEVQKEATRDSKGMAEGLSSLVGSESPIMSAQQNLDLSREVFSTLKKEEVEDAFKKTFDTSNHAYVLILPASKDASAIPTKSDVLAAVTAAWNKKSIDVAETAAATSILPDEPTPGTVVSRENNNSIGVTNVVFANGVVMHHKFLDTKKDQVEVKISLPGGAIEETALTKGLSSLASQVLNDPATHRLTSTEIRDLMIGKNVAVNGDIGLDAMSIGVGGSPADLPDGLRLARALLTDGVLESSSVDLWKKAQLHDLKTRETSAMAHLKQALTESVGADDLRITPLTADDINAATKESAEQWFNHIAKNSAIEVVVVGDIKADDAIDLVARYLGSLPKRSGTFGELDSLRKLNRAAGPFVKTVDFPGVTPMAMVLAGYIGCEELNLDRRPLSLASMILTERMIQRIRIKDNLVYSIGCQNVPGQSIPGLGQIYAAAPTDPKNAERLAATIKELFKSLADAGPTDQEVATAKKQIANVLASQMKEPGFWIIQLSNLQYHHRSLAELEQIPGVFQVFTADQIRDTLRKYVTDQEEIRIESIPQISSPVSATDQAVVPGSR
jgi:zinc protease